MNISNLKNIKTAFTAVLFLVAMILGVFAVLPEWRKYQSIQKGLRGLEGIIVEIDDLLRAKEELRKKKDSIAAGDLDKIAKAVPLGANQEEFLRFLEHIMGKNGVGLSSIDLIESGPKKQVSELPRPGGSPAVGTGIEPHTLTFSLSVAANYGVFKRLLNDFERNARVIDLNSLTFSAMDSDSVRTQFSVRGVTYFQP